jgi:hypothetical protein
MKRVQQESRTKHTEGGRCHRNQIGLDEKEGTHGTYITELMAKRIFADVDVLESLRALMTRNIHIPAASPY